MIRALLDTNVLVSAILTNGLPAELMRVAGRRSYRLVTSGYVLDETRTVLTAKLGFDAGDVDVIVARLARESELVPVFEASRSWCGDPGDDAVIESAIRGDATFLVTGDRLLLDTTVEGLTIVTPREFSTTLGSQ